MLNCIFLEFKFQSDTRMKFDLFCVFQKYRIIKSRRKGVCYWNRKIFKFLGHKNIAYFGALKSASPGHNN